MNAAHPLEGAHNECMQAYEASKKLRQSGRKIFSVQLRDTRTQLGMTCRQLGSAIGVTGQLISQIETTAKSILSRDQVMKIIDLCLKGKHPSAPSLDSKIVEESSNKLVTSEDI